jgi:thiamine biosynthesis lipoprotein
MRTPLAAIAPMLAAVLLLAACAPPERVHALDGASMGTTWNVQLVAPDAELPTLRATIERELDAVIAQMSAWEPESDLSRFNRSAAGTWQTLPEPLFDVFSHALALARDTDGAYDPTVGPLVNLWGFGPEGDARTTPPDAAQIESARARVGWHRIELDPPTRRALQPGGIEVDVSSLGPGHAIDRIAARLREHGVRTYLIELGGEMLAAGRKPGGHAWRVAVEPAIEDDAGEPGYDTVLALHDQAAGSSGDYRVGFQHEGRRYSHTIDPRSGAPVAHDLAGVTALAPSAMQADAYAAALMVLGPERGLAWANERGIAAVFTRRTAHGYERVATPALERWRAR